VVAAAATIALGSAGNLTSAASRPGKTGAANAPARPAPAPAPVEPAPLPIPNESPDSRRLIELPGQQKQKTKQPSARPTTPNAPPDTLSVQEGLALMERVVDEGDRTDEIRFDVAHRLDRDIDDLQDDLDDRRGVDLDRGLGEIRNEIVRGLAKGGITKARADQLNGIMERIQI
jgi:hypothetical protein